MALLTCARIAFGDGAVSAAPAWVLVEGDHIVAVGAGAGAPPHAPGTGVAHPGIAFIPWVGAWIVLFETIRKSGWLGLLVLVPYVGILIVSIWTAIEVPQRHGRSQWWTAALVVPVVNICGYWAYALTLDAEPNRTLLGTAA